MEIRESFSVTAERDRVAAMLLDVESVSSCVPGVEDVSQADDGSYEATLSVRMGPIKANFAGSLSLDGTQAPSMLSGEGRGRDRSTNSQVSVTMEATLTPTDTGTDVDVVAQVTIRGRLGQFGTGVIKSTASEMTKAFASCLQEKLEASPNAEADGPASSDDAAPPTGKTRQPSVSLLRVVIRGMWSSLKRAVGRLLGRRPSN